MCGCPNASETYPTDFCATPSLCVSPQRAGFGDHGYSFPATGAGSTRTQPPSPDSSVRLRSSPGGGLFSVVLVSAASPHAAAKSP
jgi:hypothetical protein